VFPAQLIENNGDVWRSVHKISASSNMIRVQDRIRVRIRVRLIVRDRVRVTDRIVLGLALGFRLVLGRRTGRLGEYRTTVVPRDMA